MKRLYYGMVGNGETVGLIGPDLALRWMCAPRFDGTPFFASALDPTRGGQLALRWPGWDGQLGDGTFGQDGGNDPPGKQHYIPETNVLQTTVTAGGLRVQAVDAMPWGQPVLVRRMTVTPTDEASGAGGGTAGTPIDVTAVVTPVASRHWPMEVRTRRLPVHGAADHEAAAIVGPGGALVAGWLAGSCHDRGQRLDAGLDGPGPVGGQVVDSPLDGAQAVLPLRLVRPAPGADCRFILLLAYGRDEAEATDRWRAAAGTLVHRPPGDPAGLQQEIAFWHDWLKDARRPDQADPDLHDAYIRGLLVMKLLTHEQSGGILAAPTASFPAVPGGQDNWDYRYVWIRDGYYTARTFDEAGLHQEARAFYEFVLRLQEPEGHWRQPLYTLDGGGPEERLIDDLQGPGGEQPVRFGNAAYDQLQIDNEPSVLHGLWVHAQKTKDEAFFRKHWPAIRRAAQAMTRLWPQKENGIWEIRERRDHWLYGKALCFAGFEAAADLADWLGYGEDAHRWRAEAERIRQHVLTHGYSEARGAYLQTYDPNSPLDISALALVLWGMLPADDGRIGNTVAKMETPLHRPPVSAAADGSPTTDDPYWGLHHLKGGLEIDGAYARYDYGAEPFYLPTLWMARYHLRAGNRARAEQLVRVCLRGATNLGLMAEHFSPSTGTQWGNFPQAFSHEELALTILELDDLP